MDYRFSEKARFEAPGFEADELKGFARTVAEIEWLLVILVMLYQVVQGRYDDANAQIYLGICLFGLRAWLSLFQCPPHGIALEAGHRNVGDDRLHYLDPLHTGRLESPLTNLYLLPIITSALTLGKLITLLEMALIAACHIFVGYTATNDSLFWITNAGDFMTQLAPMLLVAYITTMLSADIRTALTRIKLISETDELTGIFNVRAFTSLADRMHKQSIRYGHAYSILMVDSDNLKSVNDAYGHEAGNRLLKLTVTCMQKGLRETDVFARYGGDEFVIMLPQTKADGALQVSERIRKSIAATPLETHGKEIATTVSIGVASFPAHGEELATNGASGLPEYAGLASRVQRRDPSAFHA